MTNAAWEMGHATWCPLWRPEALRHKVAAPKGFWQQKCTCGFSDGTAGYTHQFGKDELVYEDGDCRVYYNANRKIDHGYRLVLKQSYVSRRELRFSIRYGDFGLWEYLKWKMKTHGVA